MRIVPSRVSSIAVPSASLTRTVNGCGSVTEPMRPDGTRSVLPADGVTVERPVRDGDVGAAVLDFAARRGDYPVLGSAHG